MKNKNNQNNAASWRLTMAALFVTQGLGSVYPVNIEISELATKTVRRRAKAPFPLIQRVLQARQTSRTTGDVRSRHRIFVWIRDSCYVFQFKRGVVHAL